MSLFNRQRSPIRYSGKEKTFFAWNLVGILFALSLIYIMLSNFARATLRIPTEGIVEVRSGSTLLYEGRNYCATSVRLWSFGQIDIDVEDGACN